MGSTYIEITRESHPPSAVGEEEELRRTGVHASPRASPHISPQYSEKGGESSHESPSEFRGEEFHLPYPNEIQDGDTHSSDSASRIGQQTRPPDQFSRSSSSRRGGPVKPGLHRSRELASDEDSTIEFNRDRDAEARQMHRDRYYGNNGAYPHSNSSGPPSYYNQGQNYHPGQMIPYPHQQPPIPMPYSPHYPQMNSPSTVYAPSHPGFAPYQAHPGSHMNSPYSPNPYGMMPYGPPGYFPPQYAPQYPLAPHMDAYRVYSSPPPPSQSPPVSVSTAPTSEPGKSNVDPDDIAKKIGAIMLAQGERESQERLAREEVRVSAEKAAAEREAVEKRIREEATASATKAAEDARRAETERAARDQQIREEAAAAALKKAAEEAEAKTAKAAADKKIADEAAAAAKTEAEKKAAKLADKAKEESEKKQKEAEEKLKEAEEAAAKAKKEAEEAKKAAEAAAPKEKKAPIRFHDAVGRKFNFPFEICCRWRGMEMLINQAFQHIDGLNEHVEKGHYDLFGPGGEVILKSVWDAVVEPDWQIKMEMWKIAEEEKLEGEDGIIPVPDMFMDGGLSMDDILGTGKGKDKSKGSSKRNRSRPGGLTSWMLGGASGSRAKASGRK